MDKKIKLDIGSGRAHFGDYITVDKDPSVKADLCLDIESDLSPLDFCKENFLDQRKLMEQRGEVACGYNILRADEIRAHHILEHVRPENKVKVMALFWELLKEGGVLDIEVPLFPHPASIQDPTHLSFWCKESFKYFIKNDPFGESFAKRYSEYKVPLFEFVEEWYRGDCLPYWAYGIKLKKI